ncbi:MAG: tRNA pseudouridine(55) synthase TruB [Planctomycetes bacterium]|nr:tRNA pseudouridine(55) synthase TruB [Planctomycetota bacterium]
MSYFGILNLNKPSGITTRDAVDRVVRLVGKKIKVGHAGTLDPLASGVLVVCVGSATRLIDKVQEMPKRYRGTFLLGRTSDTEDVEGIVTELPEAPIPLRTAIEAAAASMLGTIQQRPPAYSALKVAGRRAYKLARRGEQPELKPRPVTIHTLEVIDYDYPRLTLDIRCGSGTYVRSLGRDLAEQLGSGAVMSELTRTEIGDFHLANACELDGLTAASLPELMQSPLSAVPALPVVELTDDMIHRIGNGQSLSLSPPWEETKEMAAVDEQGTLVALLVRRGDDLYGPERVFVV